MDRAFDRSHLSNVARRQSESIVLVATKLMYIYKMKVMTDILNLTPGLREEALEIRDDGSTCYHTGKASKVCKLK